MRCEHTDPLTERFDARMKFHRPVSASGLPNRDLMGNTIDADTAAAAQGGRELPRGQVPFLSNLSFKLSLCNSHLDTLDRLDTLIINIFPLLLFCPEDGEILPVWGDTPTRPTRPNAVFSMG
jgi:hypothetical protein